jgi:hypothetical protein
MARRVAATLSIPCVLVLFVAGSLLTVAAVAGADSRHEEPEAQMSAHGSLENIGNLLSPLCLLQPCPCRLFFELSLVLCCKIQFWGGECQTFAKFRRSNQT